MNENHMTQLDRYARHGGVHFTTHVSEQEINRYIDRLSEQKRASMYTVMKELEGAGLITIANDGVLADGEGRLGGSPDCGEPR
jgi:hypothetical protein